MANSIYSINKGINRSIEFRGLKAQYIGWLAGGLVCLLMLFAILYMLGVNTYITLFLTLSGGAGLFTLVYRLSNKYGQFGMMKRAARRMIPIVIKCNSRKQFIKSK
jgi:Domain of unknown function (DUF4133)